jgi:hypothetical protein
MDFPFCLLGCDAICSAKSSSQFQRNRALLAAWFLMIAGFEHSWALNVKVTRSRRNSEFTVYYIGVWFSSAFRLCHALFGAFIPAVIFCSLPQWQLSQSSSCVEQGPHWAAIQGVSRLQESEDSIVDYLCLVHALAPHFFETNFNILLSPVSSSCASILFFTIIFVCHSKLLHVCYIFHFHIWLF